MTAPTNDFLAFANGGDANVISQSAYAALGAIDTGFTAGIARSDQVNKALRQGTFVAAAISQLICDQTGSNVNDDGNIATYEALLLSMIAAAVSQSSYVVSTNSGNAYAATVDWTPTLASGLQLTVRFPAVNSADAPTFNLNGSGAKTIYTKDFTTTVPKGRLPIEGILTYHTSLSGWVLMTELAAGSYDVDSNTNPNAITVQQPGIRALFDGLMIPVKVKTTNTGASTLNAASLGAVPIKYQGADVTAGQLVAGHYYIFVYKFATSEFWLISPPA